MNGLYKSELIYNRGPWRTVEDVELATLSLVHWWDTARHFNLMARMLRLVLTSPAPQA